MTSLVGRFKERSSLRMVVAEGREVQNISLKMNLEAFGKQIGRLLIPFLYWISIC